MDTIILLFVMAVLLVLGILMPNLTRKDIFFGVRVPDGKRETTETKAVYSAYIRSLSIGGLLLIFLSYWFVYNTTAEALYSLPVFLLIILQTVFYIIAHQKIKGLKADQDWNFNKRQVVVIDTKKQKNEKILSSWWFLVNVGILLINLILVYLLYAKLPSSIPTHWNNLGIPDHFVDKTLITVLIPSLIQFFVVGVLFFTFKTISWSKGQIDADDKEASMLRNQLFRKRWSLFIFGMAVLLQIFLSLQNARMILALDLSTSVWAVIEIIQLVFIFGAVVWIAVTTGQGGSRININRHNKQKIEEPQTEINRDDDRHWKLGLFYFNRNDPSIFLEKRFGIGFTINFGNPIAIVIFVAILLLIAGSTLIPGL